ncbi:MAG: hypothetical protein WCE90_01160 [Candidatus Zixiibacteriota bacterium]
MPLAKSPKSPGEGLRAGLTLGLGFCLLLVAVGSSFAYPKPDSVEPTVSASGSALMVPTLLDALLLLGILVCFLISLRVKSFLRDGELASGWTLFSLSFVFLFVAQSLNLLANVNFLSVAHSIISSVRLLSILFLAFGIYFMKRVLS